MGYTNITSLLLSAGTDINFVDTYNSTPLVYAVRAEAVNIDMVKLLISAGADLDFVRTVKHRHLHHDTPLMSAAWSGHLEIVEVLIDSGATIDFRNNHGHTALSHASQRQS